MVTETTVRIGAPAPLVWGVFTDVERWPEWTESVRSVRPLDGAGIDIGRRFEIDQPRMPRLVWEVTDVAPGTSWAWRQRSPGATTVAFHEVVAVEPDQTVVRQRIEQRGPLGVLVGRLTRRMTKRYLELEGQGLKARSEQLRHRGAAPA